MTFTFTGPITFSLKTTELLLELVKLRQLIITMRTDIMDQMDELKAALDAGAEVAAQNLAVGQQAIDLLTAQSQRISELLALLQDQITTGASPAEMQEAIAAYNAQIAAEQDETARMQTALDAAKPAEPPAA